MTPPEQNYSFQTGSSVHFVQTKEVFWPFKFCSTLCSHWLFRDKLRRVNMKPNRLTWWLGSFGNCHSASSALHGPMWGNGDWLQVMLDFTEQYVFIYVLWHRKELTKKQLITAIISQDCNSANVMNNDSQVERMKKRRLLLWYYSYCVVTIFHLLSNEELPKYTEHDRNSTHLMYISGTILHSRADVHTCYHGYPVTCKNI